MEGLVRELHHACLSALYSGGIIPTSDQLYALREAAWRSPARLDDIVGPRRRQTAADMLAACGFAPDLDHPAPFLFPTPDEPRDRPCAGHQIRLLDRWSIAKEGSLMTLSGPRNASPNAFTIGAGSHYWEGHDKAWVSLSSGGPASIAALRLDRLQPSTETAIVQFWRFRGSPEAHSGVYFARPMPVWLWAPGADADDFVTHPEYAEATA